MRLSLMPMTLAVAMLSVGLAKANGPTLGAYADTSSNINAAAKARVSTAHNLLYEGGDARTTITEGNARRAEMLLLSGRRLADLTPEELSLVCKARNEIGRNPPAELEAAEQLWRVAPGSVDAVRWMENTVYNMYMYEGFTQKVIAFADLCLSNHFGNPTDMLALKAQAVLVGNHGSNPQATAEALLVQAYTLTNALTSRRSLRLVFCRMDRKVGHSLPAPRQQAVIAAVNQYRTDVLVYGRYFPYKDTSMPVEISRLVSNLSQSYADFDIGRVADLFLAPSDDNDGRQRKRFLEEADEQFWYARHEGTTNAPVRFRALCFDANNSTVLLDEMSLARDLMFRLNELQLAQTNGQWKILSLKPLVWTNVEYRLE